MPTNCHSSPECDLPRRLDLRRLALQNRSSASNICVGNIQTAPADGVALRPDLGQSAGGLLLKIGRGSKAERECRGPLTSV